MSINDPLEMIVAKALSSAKIRYNHEGRHKDQELDFYLPDYDLSIEVKAFASERTQRQLGDRTNVMLLQGKAACLAFAQLLERGKL